MWVGKSANLYHKFHNNTPTQKYIRVKIKFVIQSMSNEAYRIFLKFITILSRVIKKKLNNFNNFYN